MACAHGRLPHRVRDPRRQAARAGSRGRPPKGHLPSPMTNSSAGSYDVDLLALMDRFCAVSALGTTLSTLNRQSPRFECLANSDWTCVRPVERPGGEDPPPPAPHAGRARRGRRHHSGRHARGATGPGRVTAAAACGFRSRDGAGRALRAVASERTRALGVNERVTTPASRTPRSAAAGPEPRRWAGTPPCWPRSRRSW